VDNITTEETSGFKLTLTIVFRVTENDPYTARS
jgi:hypothetical protein